MHFRWLARANIAALTILMSAMIACSAFRTDRVANARAESELRAELAPNPDGDRAKIHRVWTDYLQSKTTSYGCQPSVHWTSSEQGLVSVANGIQLQRCFDLTDASIWPREQRHEVLAIEPVGGSQNTEYRIRARFRTDSTPNGPRSRTTIVNVYAIREGGEWKLSSALRRGTVSWRKETVGPFTYYIALGRDFSRARADSAVKFADSLATAFDVPRLKQVNYYVVESGDAMLRLYGVEVDTVYGTAGGQSLPGMIVSGDPVFAENHGHEIAHTVLIPLYYGKRLHLVASEGVVTWLGGTRSMRYPVVLRALRHFLAENPLATLDSVIAGNALPMHNHGVALLSAMVHERAGVQGIRRFLDAGVTTDEFKTRVEAILGMTWVEIGSEWKRRALASR